MKVGMMGIAKGVFLFVMAAALLCSRPAMAGEPPTTPLLRLETGMHTAMIRRIATDADERWLATASDDKSVRIWDLASGALLRVLRPPLGEGKEGKLFSVALSPDGTQVAAGGWTGYEWDRQASLYVFERESGRLLQRISGLPEAVNHLAWSPDGRFLAAALGGDEGVRVFRTADWRLVGEDSLYTASSVGLTFDRSGRLAAASYDGRVRLYQVAETGLTRLALWKAPSGTRPSGIAFSPDGARLAVGFDDRPLVFVLDGQTLDFLFAPEFVRGDNVGSLSSVAWSADGGVLYAAGQLQRRSENIIRRWPAAGRGSAADFPAAADTLMDLLTRAGGGVWFGGADPAWGALDASGRRERFVGAATANFRSAGEEFKVSRDGSRVRFGFEPRGKAPTGFDVAARRYDEADAVGLAAPRLSAPGLVIADWMNTAQPTLNGKPLALEVYEIARALAITPDGQGFVLGAEWNLRRFDRNGRELWRRPMLGAALAVNVTGDGLLAVAAYGDGTIRWHRLSDGQELLAFFPHADKKRWILWTPSGYFDASPGAEDLIGWHVNRGKDQAADFYPASRFFDQFYRPDLISEVLKNAETDQQVLARLGDKERVRIATGFKKPPRVAFAAPGNGAEVAQEEVTLRYTLEDQGGGISEVRIFQNGKILPTDTRNLAVAAAGNIQQKELKVRLGDGENIFRIVALSNDRIESEPVTLKVTRKGTTSESASTLHVLAVGINQYKNPALNLNYAEADAKGILRFFDSPAAKRLFKNVAVHPVLNQQATSANLKKKLDELAGKVSRQDVVLVYLAGHGEVVHNEWYFIPHDLVTPENEKDIQSVGLSREYLQEAIRRFPAQKVLLLLDACKSGAAAKATRGVEDRKAIAQLARSTGTYIVAASQADQFATEFSQLGHGVFTYTLLQGLDGKAGDKKVTAEGLIAYVKDALPQFTEKYRGTPQYPISWGGGSDFPLVVR